MQSLLNLQSTQNLSRLSRAVNNPFAGYGYRRAITVDNTKVAGNTDFTSYAMLVSGTYASLKTTGNGGRVTSNSGYDIIFADASLNRLSFEIEKYVPSTGEAVFWVKVPTLGATVDTTIYMYYGNSSITSSQEQATSVWSDSYVGVWHMKESPAGSAPQMQDSTGHAFHGTSNGSMASGAQVAGKIDGSLSFDGTDDYIEVNHDTSLQSYPLTISLWLKTASGAFSQGVINKYVAGDSNSFNIYFDTGTIYAWYFSDASNHVYDGGGGVSGGIVNDNAWHKIDYVVSASGGAIYTDGVFKTNQPWTGTPGAATGTRPLRFGNYNSVGASGFYSGLLDEIRIVNAARSADYITTEFNNQSSPATFYTLGSEEAL